MKALLAHYSGVLGTALSQNTLGIESLHGANNLSYKLSQIREMLCLAHSFLDHDAAAIKAVEKATQSGFLTIADVHFATSEGQPESEIEDLYEQSLYSMMLQNKYGVSIQSPKFRGRGKWSDRLRETFKHQGKPWSEQIEGRVKADVAELVENNAPGALNSHRKGCFDALVKALEGKLTMIAAGKQQ